MLPFVLIHSNFKPFYSNKNHFQPEYLLLEKIIENFGANSCYASNKTLAEWLNVSEKKVIESIRFLQSNLLISTHKSYKGISKRSLYKSKGSLAIHAEFIRRKDLKPMSKIIAILLWAYRKKDYPALFVIQKLSITRRAFQKHVKILRTAGIIETNSYCLAQNIAPVSLNITREVSIHTTSNKQIECKVTIKESEEDSTPSVENIDTVIQENVKELSVQPCEQQHEQTADSDVNELHTMYLKGMNNNKINIHETFKSIEAEITEPVNENSDSFKELLSNSDSKKSSNILFKQLPEYKSLIQDLERMFPEIHEGIIIQASYQSVKNKKKIKSTMFSYAVGIIRSHMKTFPDRDTILTIKPVGEIFSEALLDRRKSERRIENSIKISSAFIESEATYNENKSYYESLNNIEKLMLDSLINQIGNPFSLEFISKEFSKRTAFSEKEFSKKAKEIIEKQYSMYS